MIDFFNLKCTQSFVRMATMSYIKWRLASPLWEDSPGHRCIMCTIVLPHHVMYSFLKYPCEVGGGVDFTDKGIENVVTQQLGTESNATVVLLKHCVLALIITAPAVSWYGPGPGLLMERPQSWPWEALGRGLIQGIHDQKNIPLTLCSSSLFVHICPPLFPRWPRFPASCHLRPVLNNKSASLSPFWPNLFLSRVCIHIFKSRGCFFCT